MTEIPGKPVRPGSLTLKQAQKIIDAMVEYATNTKPGRGMAFAVVEARTCSRLPATSCGIQCGKL